MSVLRPTVIRVIASTMEGPFERPMYLAEWDVDGLGGFGYGRLVYDVDEAHVFPDQASALDTLRTQSTVAPNRPDGHENRPLMAFTSVVMPLADAKAEDAVA